MSEVPCSIPGFIKAFYVVVVVFVVVVVVVVVVFILLLRCKHQDVLRHVAVSVAIIIH